MTVYRFLLFILCYKLYVGVDTFKIQLFTQKSPREAFFNLPDDFQMQHGNMISSSKPKIKNDSVPIFRYLDNEYYGLVGIGKPVRYFKMVFDTAWGNSWVMSSSCDYSQIGCWFHTKYNSEKSFTYQHVGTPFNVNEGSYNISGFMSKDNFHIAHLQLPNYTFAEVDKLHWSYSLSKSDGVLGMSLKDLAISGGVPFMYEMIKKKVIENPIFSVKLNRDKQSNRGGHVYLGMYDPKFNGTYVYLTVTSNSYWQVQMDRVITDNGNKSFGFCLSGCQAVMDTSTNTITGPSLEINKLNKILHATLLPRLNRYQVACGTINKLPRISFIFAGKNFTLKGEQYTQEMSIEGFQVCLSSFQPVETQNVWILGGGFLSVYTTVYDLKRKAVGIGNM